MTVALDATPLAQPEGALDRTAPTGGLARYTSQLTLALASAFPDDRFLLMSDQHFELPCALENVAAGRRPQSVFERRWWTWGLPRELKHQAVDIFHGVDFAVPFPATVPAVMTIHDLSPWKSASWVDAAWRARAGRVRKRVPWMIRTRAATHIITPSEAVRREVVEFFRVDPARVTAIPLAAAAHFQPQPATGGRPYFLYAGMLEPRKNIAAILEAWSEVRKRFDVELVFAGPHREDFPLMPPQPGLKRRGVVSEEELAALYAGALALLYPSHYEGFGLPVLEAMQCGTPVIISSDPALVETAGDAAVQAGPPDNIAPGLAVAMQSLLENPERRLALRERSLRRAGEFTWERTARATNQVYRSMLAA